LRSEKRIIGKDRPLAHKSGWKFKPSTFKRKVKLLWRRKGETLTPKPYAKTPNTSQSFFFIFKHSPPLPTTATFTSSPIEYRPSFWSNQFCEVQTSKLFTLMNQSDLSYRYIKTPSTGPVVYSRLPSSLSSVPSLTMLTSPTFLKLKLSTFLFRPTLCRDSFSTLPRLNSQLLGSRRVELRQRAAFTDMNYHRNIQQAFKKLILNLKYHTNEFRIFVFYTLSAALFGRTINQERIPDFKEVYPVGLNQRIDSVPTVPISPLFPLTPRSQLVRTYGARFSWTRSTDRVLTPTHPNNPIRKIAEAQLSFSNTHPFAFTDVFPPVRWRRPRFWRAAFNAENRGSLDVKKFYKGYGNRLRLLDRTLAKTTTHRLGPLRHEERLVDRVKGSLFSDTSETESSSSSSEEESSDLDGYTSDEYDDYEYDSPDEQIFPRSPFHFDLLTDEWDDDLENILAAALDKDLWLSNLGLNDNRLSESDELSAYRRNEEMRYTTQKAYNKYRTLLKLSNNKRWNNFVSVGQRRRQLRLRAHYSLIALKKWRPRKVSARRYRRKRFPMVWSRRYRGVSNTNFRAIRGVPLRKKKRASFTEIEKTPLTPKVEFSICTSCRSLQRCRSLGKCARRSVTLVYKKRKFQSVSKLRFFFHRKSHGASRLSSHYQKRNLVTINSRALWRKKRNDPKRFDFPIRYFYRHAQIRGFFRKKLPWFRRRIRRSNVLFGKLSWNSIMRKYRNNNESSNRYAKRVRICARCKSTTICRRCKRFGAPTFARSTPVLARIIDSFDEEAGYSTPLPFTPDLRLSLAPHTLPRPLFRRYTPATLLSSQTTISYSISGTNVHYYQGNPIRQNVLAQKWWQLKRNTLNVSYAWNRNAPQPPLAPSRPMKHQCNEPTKPAESSLSEMRNYQEDYEIYRQLKNRNYILEGLYHTDLGEYNREHDTYLDLQKMFDDALGQDLQNRKDLQKFETTALTEVFSKPSPQLQHTLTEWSRIWEAQGSRTHSSVKKQSDDLKQSTNPILLPNLRDDNASRKIKLRKTREVSTLNRKLLKTRSRLRLFHLKQSKLLLIKSKLHESVSTYLPSTSKVNINHANPIPELHSNTSALSANVPVPLPLNSIFSLWSDKRLLKFILFASNSYQSLKCKTAHTSSSLPASMVIQNQLATYCFGPRLKLLRQSNAWVVPASKHFLRKKLLRSISQTAFQADVGAWSHKCVIQFAENVSGRKVGLHIGPFVEQVLTVNDHARFYMWEVRSSGFRKLLGHRIFTNEAIAIVAASFRLKDPTLLSNWICAMVSRMSFWKFRILFRYLKFLIQHLFRFSFPDYQFKGFKIRLKGKISVGGNSRSRILFYRIGDTSHSKTDNRIAYHLNYIHTFTGVMGLKLWFFY